MTTRKQLIIMNHAHNRDQPEIQVKSHYKARKPSYVCSYTWLCSLQACSNNKYILSRVKKVIYTVHLNNWCNIYTTQKSSTEGFSSKQAVGSFQGMLFTKRLFIKLLHNNILPGVATVI